MDFTPYEENIKVYLNIHEFTTIRDQDLAESLAVGLELLEKILNHFEMIGVLKVDKRTCGGKKGQPYEQSRLRCKYTLANHENKTIENKRAGTDIKCRDREIIENYLKQKEYTTRNDQDLYTLLIENTSTTGKNSKPTTSRKLEGPLEYLTSKGVLDRSAERPFKYRLKDDTYIVDSVLDEPTAHNISSLVDIVVSNVQFSLKSLNVMKKILGSNKSIMGHLAMYEDPQDHSLSKYFDSLLEAIENRYWLKLKLKYPENFSEEVRPIKLLFSDNNWYLFFDYLSRETQKRVARFGRLSFIQDIKVLKESHYSKKNRFQTKDIENYDDFFQTFQNAMTLYDGYQTPEIATLKASPAISQYFEPGMKKFLDSQTFVRREGDGGIVFKVNYTQDLEILPFIQKWMPDITILEPKALREAYLAKLQTMIERQTD